MTLSPPRLCTLLCCRCMTAEIAGDEAAKNWAQLTTRRGTVDICASCMIAIRRYLAETPP